MTTSVQRMMFSDMLNLLLLRRSNRNYDKEHVDTIDGMDGPLV
jgi:hypothetical protein